MKDGMRVDLCESTALMVLLVYGMERRVHIMSPVACDTQKIRSLIAYTVAMSGLDSQGDISNFCNFGCFE